MVVDEELIIFKKLINDFLDVVDEVLEGIVLVNFGLKLLKNYWVIIWEDVNEIWKVGKVIFILGGGSGYELLYVGFVGKGMLIVVVVGVVFIFLLMKFIFVVIRVVGFGNRGGMLLIVKNYIGDRLNFGFVVERVKVEGIKVDMVVVGEDCVFISKDKIVGRRGFCGIVLIYKVNLGWNKSLVDVYVI